MIPVSALPIGPPGRMSIRLSMTNNDNQNEAPHARVQDILLLPPLPAVAVQLLRLISREDCDIRELSELIELDPGVAARIVGIANSAYFARPTPVCSVADAITRVLGLNLVRGIAIGIALSKPFDTGACPGFNVEGYWYRAMCSAALAAQLAPLADLPDTAHGCLYLSGLLHNLGQLVLVHAFPDRMSRVFRSCSGADVVELLALEAQQVAMTETEAGTLIARRWQLPAGVTDVIEFLHDPVRAGASEPLVALIAYCSIAARTLYNAAQSDIPPQSAAGSALAGVSSESFTRAIQRLRAQDDSLRALARSLADST